MYTLQERIVREISKRNTYGAELRSFQIEQCEVEPPSNHMNALQSRINAIDIWVSFLPASQAFVIKRHLMDGLDWMQVKQEFKEKWGPDCARDERTLKRYQQKGIRTIESFVTLHYTTYAYLWMETDDDSTRGPK